MFDIVVNYVLYSEFITINIFCLAKVVRHNSFLVKCPTLKMPKKPAYFMFNIIIMAAIAVAYNGNLVIGYYKSGSLFSLLSSINSFFYFVSSMTSFFVIGVSTRYMCERIQEVEKSFVPEKATATFDTLIETFKDLKEGLAPLLLHMFFIKSIFIISYTYQFITQNNFFYFVSGLIEILAGDYLATIVEDTYKMFINTTQNLK